MRSKSKCASGGWGWLVVRGLVIAIWDMYYEFGLCGLDLETMAGLLATSGYIRPVHYTLHVTRYTPLLAWGSWDVACAMRHAVAHAHTAHGRPQVEPGYWLLAILAGGGRKPKAKRGHIGCLMSHQKVLKKRELKAVTQVSHCPPPASFFPGKPLARKGVPNKASMYRYTSIDRLYNTNSSSYAWFDVDKLHFTPEQTFPACDRAGASDRSVANSSLRNSSRGKQNVRRTKCLGKRCSSLCTITPVMVVVIVTS
jgi:hypothetical protein